MPLITQVIRDGKSVPLRWGDFHVAAMVIASAIDSGKGPFKVNTLEGILRPNPGAHAALNYPHDPITITPADSFGLCSYPVLAASSLDCGRKGYTLKSEHHFMDSQDGEDFRLLPGDILVAYREW